MKYLATTLEALLRADDSLPYEPRVAHAWVAFFDLYLTLYIGSSFTVRGKYNALQVNESRVTDILDFPC